MPTINKVNTSGYQYPHNSNILILESAEVRVVPMPVGRHLITAVAADATESAYDIVVNTDGTFTFTALAGNGFAMALAGINTELNPDNNQPIPQLEITNIAQKVSYTIQYV